MKLILCPIAASFVYSQWSTRVLLITVKLLIFLRNPSWLSALLLFPHGYASPELPKLCNDK
jgi:hypothetical protein